MSADSSYSFTYGFPGITATVIGVFCAVILSISGRKLAAHILVGCFREALLHVPFKRRIRMVSALFQQTQSRAQLVLRMFANPYGYQWDSIAKVDREKVQGHWFVSKVHERGGVQWAEKTAKDADLVIMYIHGGGFYVGTSLSYSGAMLRLLKQFEEVHGIRARIFCPDYRLFPEVQLPSFQEDNEKAYGYLVRDLHVDPSKIILGGDSAGGHTVATVLMSIRDKLKAQDATAMESIACEPLPMPKGGILISPWVNMDCVSPSYTFNNDKDCLPVAPGYRHGMIVRNFDRMSKEEQDAEIIKPYVSPVFGNYEGVCPLVVTIGGCEVFASDIEQMIQRFKDSGVKVDVIRRDDGVHIWAISRILAQNEQVWMEGINKMVDWCALTVRQ